MLDRWIRARADSAEPIVLRVDVQVVGVPVVERRAHVLPVVVQRRGHVLLAGDHDLGVGRRELEERVEVLDRQQLGDVGAVGLVLERGNLGQLAVLLGELRGGRDLDQLGVPKRALGERREPPQRLDLVSEQIDPDGAVLGRREQVEQAAANRELATVLDLVDALIAGRNEVAGGLLEVEQLARPQGEAVGSESRIGHLLGQRHGADDDDGRLAALAGLVAQRVERRDPQADQVRRWREVRLVGDTSARVVTDGPGVQPGAEPRREIASGPVVPRDDDRRALGVAVE